MCYNEFIQKKGHKQPEINISILDIANCIILENKNKYELTHMNLQKLIFYIFAKYLVDYKKPLFNSKY